MTTKESARSIPARLQAVEISLGFLHRHLTEGAKALAEGEGSVWHIRKQANSMMVTILYQLTELAIEGAKPKKEK